MQFGVNINKSLQIFFRTSIYLWLCYQISTKYPNYIFFFLLTIHTKCGKNVTLNLVSKIECVFFSCWTKWIMKNWQPINFPPSFVQYIRLIHYRYVIMSGVSTTIYLAMLNQRCPLFKVNDFTSRTYIPGFGLETSSTI